MRPKNDDDRVGAVTDESKHEPRRLARGKKFHKLVQQEWVDTAQGLVKSEKGVEKPSGRRGRIDIHVTADDDLVAVVELKASDWNKMTDQSIRRNVSRQAKQIWDYIESQLVAGKSVSPGIVFPQRPTSIDRLSLIEALFDRQGIPVVWQDETIEERKLR